MSIQLRGNDTSVFNNDVQFTSQNSGPLAGFRNQFINGDFRIWQRGTSIVTSGSAPSIADRWRANTATAGITYSQTDVDVVPGFTYAVTTDGGSGGTLGNLIVQRIELAKAGNAGLFALNSVWTLSYYSTSQTLPSSSSARFRTTGTGADSVELQVTDFQVVPGFTPIVVGSKTWTRYQAKVTINALPSAANNQLEVSIAFGPPGSNFNGMMITGAQFEPGPVATPFEHRPITVEQYLCYRYYQEASFNRIMFEGNSSTSQAQMFAAANGDQRTSSPTVRSRAGNTYVYTNGDRHEGSNEDNTQRSIVGGGISSGRARLIINRISASTTQNIQIVGGTSDDYWFTFDAEL